MTAAWFLDPQACAAAPQTATTVRCKVSRIVDGDTVQVIVSQIYRVRLKDCWAPEVRGDEKSKGLESKEHLRQFVQQHGLHGVLSVPWSEDVGKSWSMGRVIGDVWIDGQERSLSEIQCAAGHAKEKRCEH